MTGPLRMGRAGRLPRFVPPAAGVLVLAIGLAVALWLVLGLPLVILPFAPVAVGALIIVMNYPVAGLNFVVAAHYLPIEVGGFTVFQIAGATVAILTLIWFGLSKRGIVIPYIALPLVAFTLLTLYSLTFTRDSAMTAYMTRKFALNVLFCVLLINLAPTFRKFWQPIYVLVGMGVINSAVAIVQFATGWQRVEERSRGLMENENALGEVAAIAFVVPFYLLLYADRRWKRVVCLALCGVLFFGMVTSISRTAFLSFTAGLLFMLFREKRYRLRFVLLGLLLVSTYPMLPEAFSHRFQHLGAEIEGTLDISRSRGLSTRGYFNKAGIRIWKSHPILGVGLGNYGFYFQMPEFNPGIKGSRRLPPHNLYIQALAETGTVGFIVLCWWIIQAVLNYWAAEKRGVAEEHRILLRSCEAITLIALISSFSSGHLASTHLAMVLAFSEVCRRAALAGNGASLPGAAPLPAPRGANR